MLNKKIIDGSNNPENLRLVPTQDLIKLSSVLLVELEDKFVLMKNRWSHWEKGNLYVSGVNNEATPLEELDYTEYTRSDFEYILKDLNSAEYINSKNRLYKMLLDNPFVIYKSCR